jgi:hypothetical protein
MKEICREENVLSCVLWQLTRADFYKNIRLFHNYHSYEHWKSEQNVTHIIHVILFKEYPLHCLFLQNSRLIHVGWQMPKYLEMNMLTAVVSHSASHLLSRSSHWVLIYGLINQNYILTGTLFISHYKFKI